jgi:hypothetical protein
MLVNESFQTPTPSTRRVGVYMVEHRPVGCVNAVGLSDLFLAKGPCRPYSMGDAQRRARRQLRYGAHVTLDASIGWTVGDSTSRRSTQVTSAERAIRAIASSRSPIDAVANV